MTLGPLVLLTAVATPAIAGGQEAGPDVVVTHPRIHDWRAVLVFEGDASRCRVTRSSDDAEIDRVGCVAMTQCFDDARPRIDAARGPGVTRTARRRALNDTTRGVDACFKVARYAMDQRVADRVRQQQERDRAVRGYGDDSN